MNRNKRYYWLQLPENFFSDKVMKKIRNLPGGDAYTIITLKVLLLGLGNNNRIAYDGVEDTIYKEIALEIDEDPTATEVTINILLSYGWLTRESDDVLYSPKGAELTQSECSSAERVRNHRERQKALQCNTDVTQCNTSVTDVKRTCNGDIDIEKDKYIEISKYSSKDSYLSISPQHQSKIGDRDNKNELQLPLESNQKTTTEPVFIEFPLLGGKTAEITESWCDKQQSLYGQSVNVRAEIKLAIAWCEANHLKKDWKKFLNNWFASCLSHGGSKTPYEGNIESLESTKGKKTYTTSDPEYRKKQLEEMFEWRKKQDDIEGYGIEDMEWHEDEE